MSMWYAAWVELTLKLTVWPTLTLMAVAKPCRVWSPAPETSQSLVGSPCNVFSQAITLTTGGPHGPAAEAPPALVIRGNATPKRINASRLAPAFSPARILPLLPPFLSFVALALLVTSIPQCALMPIFRTRGPTAGPHLLGGNVSDQNGGRLYRRANSLARESPLLGQGKLHPWPRYCILGDPGVMW